MALDLESIKELESINLDNFEIRGVRYGINNASTTGPVYSSGEYSPNKTILSGVASLISGSDILNDIAFSSPFSGFNALILMAGDNITVSSTEFTIVDILSATSVKVDKESSLSGVYNSRFSLGVRDYLIEPDTIQNTLIGVAAFSNGSNIVSGVGTSWMSEISAGDFFKSGSYQKNYIVEAVLSNSSLRLNSSYEGSTTIESYTAVKRTINSMRVQYTKNDFEYNKRTARWEKDSTTGNNLSISTSFLPLVDGISLKFSSALKSNQPDLMERALALNKVLSQRTENDMFQYPLPEVPYPESSLTLKINGNTKDCFPNGNQDYVISYFPDPVYRPAPPMGERKVANIMMLEPVLEQTLNPVATSNGILLFTDSAGESIAGIMGGSESIWIDGTSQVANYDYVFDPDIGLAYASSFISNESVVENVAIDYTQYIDTGFKITLDGKIQKITIPSDPGDQVIFNFETGILKPQKAEHPGPNEEYIVEYLVEAGMVTSESVSIIIPTNIIRTKSYPIKPSSTSIIRNGKILTENVDYQVRSLAGRIIFSDELTSSDVISLNYIPLSWQKNGISYRNNNSYCSVYGSRCGVVLIGTDLRFKLKNPAMASRTYTINRVYNETRNKQYDISGILMEQNVFILPLNEVNKEIGTRISDIVIVDYIFLSDRVEFYPVVPVNYVIPVGKYMCIQGRDLRDSILEGALIRLTAVDIPGDFFYRVKEVTFDGEDSVIEFEGQIQREFINPRIYVTDALTTFSSISLQAFPLVSENQTVSYPGNIAPLFRPGCIWGINSDYYVIRGSEYNSNDGTTYVSLGVGAYRDYTSNQDLQETVLSINPVYYEGDKQILTARPLIANPVAPVMTMNYISNASAYINSDSSGFRVLTDSSEYSFQYQSYQNIGMLADALNTMIPDFRAVINVADWSCSHIQVLNNASVGPDSSTIVRMSPALRYNGVDTTSFSYDSGVLELDYPLVRGDRYSCDYLGARFLGDRVVSYKGRKFSVLPKGSRVEASFQFLNLDQFYVQVLGHRDFLGQVTEPRMEEEARQQNGNVGQGGDVAGDEDFGNSSGGLSGNEYRRIDSQIESKIFANIYTYFSDRIKAFGDEFNAALGLKLGNNDGLLSLSDQSSSYKAMCRIFPTTDYTSFEPALIMPLTGSCIPNDVLAQFRVGYTDVTCISGPNNAFSFWTTQLRSGDYIRPYNTSTDYTIASIVNDSSLCLTVPYSGVPVSPDGVQYVMTSKYPVFDDDGHVGAKIVGVKEGSFGLRSGDSFSISVGGSDQSHIFTDPPLLSPWLKKLNKYTSEDVVKELNSSIRGLSASSERVFDPQATYGYKTSIVLRTDGTNNYMRLLSGSAVSKLGFTPGFTDWGNFNRTDSSCEVAMLTSEKSLFPSEVTYLNNLIAVGSSNKLDRIIPANLVNAHGVRNSAKDESSYVLIALDRIVTEIASTGHILNETTINPSYTNTAEAHSRAINFYNDTIPAFNYDHNLASNWENFGDATRWTLSFLNSSQVIRGKDIEGNGVDTSTGSGITNINGQTSFILNVPSGNDIRILNTVVDSTLYTPIITSADNGSPVIGTWSGWSPGVGDQYSNNNQITFTLLDSTVMFAINETGVPQFDIEIREDGLYLYGPNDYILLYTGYPTIALMKAGINVIPGLSTIGSSIHDSSSSTGLKLVSRTSIPGSINIFNGLRASNVSYSTISDSNLSVRFNYLSARDSLDIERILYLNNVREGQIRNNIIAEELLRSLDGETGNLYDWANNRFNRSNGCLARQKQIERQMEMSSSSLKVSKKFL